MGPDAEDLRAERGRKPSLQSRLQSGPYHSNTLHYAYLARGQAKFYLCEWTCATGHGEEYRFVDRFVAKRETRGPMDGNYHRFEARFVAICRGYRERQMRI